MHDNEERTKELLEASALPFGEFIASVGKGIGEAQRDLDLGSAALFQQIYSEQGEAGLKALRDMGYIPNWYQIPELNAELKLALSISSRRTQSGSSRMRLYANSVDAGYSNQFGYSAQVASKIAFKVVPVPPPSGYIVPQLVGLSYSEAAARLQVLGIPHQTSLEDVPDDAIISDQAPAAGQRIDDDARIQLFFDSSDES